MFENRHFLKHEQQIFFTKIKYWHQEKQKFLLILVNFLKVFLRI
jgi:hypothetical protein